MNKVSIRPMKESDFNNIVKWRNSDVVMNNFIYRKPLTLKEEENWYRNKVITGEVIQFIITVKETGQDIGSVYFKDIDKLHNKCEFGIFIGEEDMLSKGYGSEAMGLAIDKMFNEYHMNKIYLKVISGNDRAYNTYKKLGFVKEGIAKQDAFIDGKYIDIIYMARFRTGENR